MNPIVKAAYVFWYSFCILVWICFVVPAQFVTELTNLIADLLDFLYDFLGAIYDKIRGGR